MPGAATHRAASRLWTAALAALLAAGCRFEFARVRSGQPLREDVFTELEPGKSSQAEALAELGAPDRVNREPEAWRLSWEYIDQTHFQTRAQLPISLFGYRHNLFRYFENRDQACVMDLVFDRSGILKEKSLRLPEAYREKEEERGAHGRFIVAPRFEYNFALLGDADVRDYDDLFETGPAAGIDIGYQPIAPVVFSVGGRVGAFPGRTVTFNDGRQARFDDLEVYGGEAMLRLLIPLAIFSSSENLSRAWEILVEDDPGGRQGWIFFIEAGIGATVNGNVPVAIDGAPSGNFFDSSVVLSNSATSGLEYRFRNIGLRLGLSYRSAGGFEDGDSPLPDDADALQTLGASASLELRF